MAFEHIMLYPCTRCGATAHIGIQAGRENAVFPVYHVICGQCGRVTAPQSLTPEDAAEVWNSGAHVYRWTTTLPQQTGWYWLRRAGQEPIVAHALVTHNAAGVAVMLLGDDGVREQVYRSAELEWSDRPIMLPMERTMAIAEEPSHA